MLPYCAQPLHFLPVYAAAITAGDASARADTGDAGNEYGSTSDSDNAAPATELNDSDGESGGYESSDAEFDAVAAGTFAGYTSDNSDTDSAPVSVAVLAKRAETDATTKAAAAALGLQTLRYNKHEGGAIFYSIDSKLVWARYNHKQAAAAGGSAAATARATLVGLLEEAIGGIKPDEETLRSDKLQAELTQAREGADSSVSRALGVGKRVRVPTSKMKAALADRLDYKELLGGVHVIRRPAPVARARAVAVAGAGTASAADDDNPTDEENEYPEPEIETIAHVNRKAKGKRAPRITTLR